MGSQSSGALRAFLVVLRIALLGLPGGYCLALSSATLADVVISPGSTLDFLGSGVWYLPLMLIAGAVLMLLSVNRLREPEYLAAFIPVPFLVCAAPLLRELGSPIAWFVYPLILIWPAVTFVFLRRAQKLRG